MISDANLFNMAKFGGDVRLYGPATRVGGLVGYNAGKVTKSKVDAGSLSLANLTAGDSTVTAGGALGENTGTAENVTVSTNLQDSMAKYLNLGGVAGSSSGTLSNCTYTAPSVRITALPPWAALWAASWAATTWCITPTARPPPPAR